ncbi:class I SAM-dependent methyltransferase [Pararhodobacter sp.]|uniref:class I SAM-dependent methyltransferase n=1 Tax=Pararhodobacter sp. TaxID=2127056 RepID=UPI002AFDE751|nr:class I SAM-dependent methyltransferase [Pararhodobacter sp.]
MSTLFSTPPRPIPDALAEAFNRHWAPRMGAIDGHDLVFIHHLMTQHQPKRIVEIGCCTGFSTGIMAQILAANGGGEIHSLDVAETVYFDPSKPVGYLIEAFGHADRVSLHTGATALDLRRLAGDAPFDMAFIDASHQHPWPIFDTLALLPFLKPGAPIIHHDLQLYRNPGNKFGVGPKMLFDRLSPAERLTPHGLYGKYREPALKTRTIDNNIFAVMTPETLAPLADQLAEGLYFPWHLQKAHHPSLPWLMRFAEFLEAHYPASVARAFDVGHGRYMG